MKQIIKCAGNMRLIATNEMGHETHFDAREKDGGDDSAPSPMEVMLQSVAACSAMDILHILKQQRKEVSDLGVHIEGIRAEDYPRVFRSVSLRYEIISPDVTKEDLDRAIQLSMDKYCSAAAMFKAAGCDVKWECDVKLPVV